jgi:hypothetical protein
MMVVAGKGAALLLDFGRNPRFDRHAASCVLAMPFLPLTVGCAN